MYVTRPWIPGSTLRLVKVNWDSGYRDVIEWNDQDEKDIYFSGLSRTDTYLPDGPFTHIRPNESIDLNMQFNDVLEYNYIIVENPTQPGTQEQKRKYYYFITSAQYLAPDTTKITVQLDVWTTFVDTTTFGQSFVERGHIGIANQNATLEPSSLRRYQSIPEGLDIGDQLVSYMGDAKNLFDRTLGESFEDDYKWGIDDINYMVHPMIMIVSTVSLIADPGTADAPTMATASPSTTDNIWTASHYVAIPGLYFDDFMRALIKFPWISRNIITIYAIPGGLAHWERSTSLFSESTDPALRVFSLIPVYTLIKARQGTLTKASVFNWITNCIPNEYRKIKKLFTSPYSFVELSGPDGTPIIFKPEQFNSSVVSFKMIANFVAPFNRVAMYPEAYGASDNSPSIITKFDQAPNIGDATNPVQVVWKGDTLGNALWFGNFPQFPIINDGYLGYYAGSAYIRDYQKSYVEWQKNLGLNTAANELANATGEYEKMLYGLGTPRQAVHRLDDMVSRRFFPGQGGNAYNRQTAANAALDTLNGGTQMLGDMLSTVMSPQNPAETYHSAEMANQAMNRNFDLAIEIANKDYEMDLENIASQVQQAQINEPSQSGLMSGDGFGFATGSFVYRIAVKVIGPNAMHVVGDFLLRYGIKIHEFMLLPSKLCCMSKFAYWKCSETYIVDSDGNETDRNVLRGILERGTTVWKQPSFIGRTSLQDNEIVSGYRY